MSVLNKPVNKVLYKPTIIEKVDHSRRLVNTFMTHTMNLDRSILPKEEKPRKKGKKRLPTIKTGKSVKNKVFLRVVYDGIPDPDPAPPCGDCKNSPCCRSFIVALTEDEARSGLYDEFLVKVEPYVSKQMLSSSLMKKFAGYNLAAFADVNEPVYVIDSPTDVPCPFLVKEGCSIYEDRPLTCRVYSCVGDNRINDLLRNGDIYNDD